jgi:3-deoxy-D-manno-octulosonic-acid transferase
VAERLPLPLRTYRRVAAIATPLLPLLWSYRRYRGKEHRPRMRERRGETTQPRPDAPLVWMHAASVGEMLAVIPLVEHVHSKDFAVLVTSGTVTSAQMAESRLPPGVIHQFSPYDSPRYVARFLDHWRPDLGIFSESDLWPNLITAAGEREVPLILVNGRLSERSFLRWQRLPETIAALLRHFELCLAQSVRDAERYDQLGAPRVTTTGNLKLDVPAPPADDRQLATLKRAIGARPVIAAASTHPGEEKIIIDVHQSLKDQFPDLLTIIVPRHPERGPGIMHIASNAGLKATARSRGHLPDRSTAIYLADTLGELGLIYRLASIVFIGGSMIRHGGQNPIEAAKLGTAIVHGPHVWNFADIYAALNRNEAAARVNEEEQLGSRIATWLSDPGARQEAAKAALQTVESLAGARDRTLAALEPYLLQLRLHYR